MNHHLWVLEDYLKDPSSYTPEQLQHNYEAVCELAYASYAAYVSHSPNCKLFPQGTIEDYLKRYKEKVNNYEL